MRILIVDDSPFTGEAIAHVLRKAGFETQVARDLWDLESPNVQKPDLVLMDVVLSEAFGDDLAPLLRASHGFECPIFLISSLPEAELEQRVADAGLDGFISKRVGLAGVVARVREALSPGAGGQPSPAGASQEKFDITAHQRLRRLRYVAGDPKHWNMTAIVSEMHALAGDADLAGASAIANAARKCHEVVRAHGSAGMTPEIAAAFQELAAAVGNEPPLAGKLLVVDGSTFFHENLYPALDRAGYVVMEAYSLAEARQKLHATDYNLILVDDAIARQEPSLVPELRGALPETKLEIVGVAPLAKSTGPTRLVEEIDRLVHRRT